MFNKYKGTKADKITYTLTLTMLLGRNITTFLWVIKISLHRMVINISIEFFWKGHLPNLWKRLSTLWRQTINSLEKLRQYFKIRMLQPKIYKSRWDKWHLLYQIEHQVHCLAILRHKYSREWNNWGSVHESTKEEAQRIVCKIHRHL